jgi:arrestin-2
LPGEWQHIFFWVFNNSLNYFNRFSPFAQVIVTIRYGREQDEVMGLKFVKELVLINEQVVPARRSQDKKPSALQVTFLKNSPNTINEL